ncbi:MAG: ABC-type multidrug transport system, ATPase component, partial [Myxococcaceae bacterium]|nr:ABC-type multidrug transport system, ATPase component [Myxococcaceae bacterium]
MIPGFGKEQISIGSAPDNEVVLQGPGVAPRHARIAKQNGQLVYFDAGAGVSTANGQPVAANQPIPFDFRTQFVIGQGVADPLSHPAIVLMTMARGSINAPPGHLVIGREAASASLVIHNSAV